MLSPPRRTGGTTTAHTWYVNTTCRIQSNTTCGFQGVLSMQPYLQQELERRVFGVRYPRVEGASGHYQQQKSTQFIRVHSLQVEHSCSFEGQRRVTPGDGGSRAFTGVLVSLLTRRGAARLAANAGQAADGVSNRGGGVCARGAALPARRARVRTRGSHVHRGAGR